MKRSASIPNCQEIPDIKCRNAKKISEIYRNTQAHQKGVFQFYESSVSAENPDMNIIGGFPNIRPPQLTASLALLH
jgi:hypothetical protein